ncbi:hypothetical protein V2J09_002992 [Rumex salicifolius]
MDMESVSGTVSESVGLGLFLSEERWKDHKMRGWATFAALLFILLWQSAKWLSSRKRVTPTPRSLAPSTQRETENPAPADGLLSPTVVSDVVSDADLKSLIDSLDERDIDKWEDVIEKSSHSLVYKAKCCKPKDGPLKYLSMTLFEGCSPEVLRDFYMDNDFRKQWDKTLVEHEQLHVDETTGVEIGRTIKKFPLLTPREYVLAWRVWEGQNNVFYCFIKDLDHPMVPRSRKYVRVGSFRSVPGRNACEIKMVHQEDAGFNVEMAKLAFAKGIWSYVCKMEKALRKFSSRNQGQLSSALTAVTYIKRVPAELEEVIDVRLPDTSSQTPTILGSVSESVDEIIPKELKKMPSKKLIANGLLLLGGLLYLSKSHHSLGTKVAVACIWKKLNSKRADSGGKN